MPSKIKNPERPKEIPIKTPWNKQKFFKASTVIEKIKFR
jgi:hypothetical protein